MNNTFQVLLKENSGLSRKAVPLQFGLPFPKGLPYAALFVFDTNITAAEGNLFEYFARLRFDLAQ